MQFNEMTIHELRRLLRAGEVSSQEVLEAVLARIDEVEGEIGAYLALCREEAFAQAQRADEMLSKGDASPLCGIPISLKDNFTTAGVRTTCASRLLENYIPPFDAAAAARLKEAGAVLVGKTNLDEFGLGSSTENSPFHCTRNPWDRPHDPGRPGCGSDASGNRRLGSQRPHIG